VQREILDQSESSNLRVYAVWLPFLGANEQAADVSHRVLPDPRVIHYWDPDAAVSDWFAENVDHITAKAWWDVYYLYGPDARWRDVPGPLIASGGTIIGRSAELKGAITPLLQGASPAP
jgi:hypothetical protein